MVILAASVAQKYLLKIQYYLVLILTCGTRFFLRGIFEFFKIDWMDWVNGILWYVSGEVKEFGKHQTDHTSFHCIEHGVKSLNFMQIIRHFQPLWVFLASEKRKRE